MINVGVHGLLSRVGDESHMSRGVCSTKCSSHGAIFVVVFCLLWLWMSDMSRGLYMKMILVRGSLSIDNVKTILMD